MGLDITAYEHATLLDDHGTPATDWCEAGQDGEDEHQQAYVYTPFAASAAGLELLGASDGITFGRCYRLHGSTLGFRAGSYSGYNRWRDALICAAAEIATEGEPAPFALLTNFADNEGWIGPMAAAELAKQFERHGAAVKQLFAEGPDTHDMAHWFVEKYDEWVAAFKLAAGTGTVRFH
jgi:hypothetical protein